MLLNEELPSPEIYSRIMSVIGDAISDSRAYAVPPEGGCKLPFVELLVDRPQYNPEMPEVIRSTIFTLAQSVEQHRGSPGTQMFRSVFFWHYGP